MSSAGDSDPGLMGLWDIMINYQIFGLCHLLTHLKAEEIQLEYRIGVVDIGKQHQEVAKLEKVEGTGIFVDELVTDADIDRMEGWLRFAKQQADQLELQAVHDRLERFSQKIRIRIRLYDFQAEVRTLRETIESGISFKYFYKYPQRKAEVLLRASGEWAAINKAFPAVEAEAKCAADLYALDHNTGSVFHSMRVAEHGLRALAKERRIVIGKNKPVEWATWQDIIRALEAEAKVIGGKKVGRAKDRALEFYSGAIADLNGFKDEYRNLVMHVRAEYDELQALRAYQRVHAFMERLAKKLDHKHHRIKWGLR
ncbi:MAG: hypothetical protein P4M07_03495 [Xanthobacteraceae bacterium]|nr:hypothetical protein [Xanthobacteraceae bacterium]